MEADSFEKEKLKSNKNNLENEKININVKSEISLNGWFKKALIITSFLIYLIIVYIFCTKLYSNKNINRKTEEEINSSDFAFDPKRLDNIENYLKILKPRNSYNGPVFPDDGKITLEWMLELL